MVMRKKLGGIIGLCVADALMRILPLAFYLCSSYGANFTGNDEAYKIIHNVSSLTHAHQRNHIACGVYLAIAASLFDAPDLKSGGYVVDTLEAALWCLLNTDSYESCVLKAVNLGEDTDTVAAVAGGLAGIYYGYEAIPQKWTNQIARLDYIKELCEM